MPESTPYDEDRNSYSRQALARLALSASAVGVADTAAELVATRYDAYSGPGGRAGEASALTGLAAELLSRAVVYERERGTSWADIAVFLDIDADTAEERFTPALTRWNTAFEVPYRLDETGRKRVPQLPTAAYDPRGACRRLDLWADVRLGFSDKHAVSGSLDGAPDPGVDPRLDRHQIDGFVPRRHLETFLGVLSGYVGCFFDAEDEKTVALGIEGTDDEDPDGWYSYPMEGPAYRLRIAMAACRDGDFVAITVSGSGSAVLRVRIDTLMTALTEV